MSAFSWGLLLKPFVGLAILAFLYFSARGLAWLIYVLLPDSRAKRYLFQGWATARKASAPRLPE